MNDLPYDAILVMSFGGPEGPADVMPFLENVTRGRNIPADRLAEVAEHYHHFGGVSPHNAQIKDLLAALEPELRANDITLPVYWGNRNWHPMVRDTVQQMKADGVKHFLAFVFAGYSSYSSCRQYRENIDTAIDGTGLTYDKIRVFYNHPDFITANRDRVHDALNKLPETEREIAPIVFTAHSIPTSMATGCDYEKQLLETARLITESLANPHMLCWQSRSGPPQVPWLEPDICDQLEQLHAQGSPAVVIAPIGFLSDHLEVLFDLDTEAAQKARELGLSMQRAATVGTHPAFIGMIRKLIAERLDITTQKEAIGCFGPNHDRCPADCCPAPQRPPHAHGRPAQ